MNKYSTSHQINFGLRITPIKRVELFSPDEWEELVEEWLDLKKTDYIEIERFGGAGDKGRDVVAYITDYKKPNYKWDCYQCKHYDNSIMPSQVYVEFGKILYYTFIKEYPIPQNYYFIAPKGCGNTLSKLLNNSALLKEEIKKHWDNDCKNKITSSPINLIGKFKKYVDSFDFTIFSKKHIKEILDLHKNHSNHLTRFGGGLPQRERLNINAIPKQIQNSEVKYVEQLIKAYNSVSSTDYETYDDLKKEIKYQKHFSRARINFHHAEQLRNFSRDNLPINTFDDFQNEILSAVIDIVEDNHENDFIRVKETEKEAEKVIISSNPLKDVCIIQDKKGICHQLVNDEKVKWNQNEE